MPLVQPDPGPPGTTRRQFLRHVALGSLALTALAACGDDPVAPTPVGASVDDLGATGDGVTDDGPALQRALDGLRTGETLRFTPGRTYAHATTLVLTVPGVVLSGAGTLLATDEERSALRLEADDVTVEDLQLGVASTTKRWDAPDQHRLYAANAAGLVLRRVRVTGSAASGVFLDGVSDFLLEDLDVADTRADGVHLTRGTSRGQVVRPRTSRTGDDGVAVVSYLEDGAVCREIEVLGPVVRTTSARGVSVVGGEDVTYRDIDVEDTAAAGVYLACEGDPYFTEPTRRVRVLGGSVRGANRDADIDHGAVLVFAGRDGGEVSDVEVSGLALEGTRRSASRQVGVVASAGSTSAVVLADLAVEADPEPFSTNTDTGCCDVRGWTVDGRDADVTA